MEFGFTEEQEKFRKEVSEFFVNEVPKDCDMLYGALSEEIQSFAMRLQKKAAEKGYLIPGWLKEYGGLGLGEIEQAIVSEEGGYYIRQWPNFTALHLAGPAVILFGTEEQKKEFLPPIARGEVIWCQAFSEPDAGTDESNVQLRAAENGDEFILNGQKHFISGSYKVDYLYTLARTADTVPKHRGLSLFLIPADLPGITFRAQCTMGDSSQNEIFFDDVRVSKKYLLGQLNRGFYHAMATFEFERSGTDWPAQSRRILHEFIDFCKEEKRNGKSLIQDPKVRETLAQMVVETEVFRLAAWRSVWWFSQRERLGPQPYDITALYWKIFPTSQAKAMMDIMGLYGQLKKGSRWTKLAGRIEREWKHSRSHHGGGTPEANKIVLAGRGLGLPRIPAQLNPAITQALREMK